MKVERCPGCRKKVYDYRDFVEHVECVIEADRAKYDETDRDDFDRRSDHEPS